jgi:deoxyribodipyrimidine photo-lyase
MSAPGDSGFIPTRQAAFERLGAVRPDAYAATRNHLDGAVTRLSPYLTHGLLTLREVAESLTVRHALPIGHKLVSELGWRAYFHHVWQHAGDTIFESLHDGPWSEAAYARALPADVREARTGVPVIDRAVADLYEDGWLHNHARMWLASYLVHLRKVHWRAGADWLYGHLLDGDLASNHLSWQWVAGTGSTKPYLFNAENVARFAPAAWHSPGTVIDTSYEALDRIARSADSLSEGRNAALPVHAEPSLWHAPPPDLGIFSTPEAQAVSGRDVWLVHPWALRAPAPELPAETLRVGVCVADFHRRWAWSERRWRFVTQSMAPHTDVCWWGETPALRRALAAARSVRGVPDPHLGTDLDPAVTWMPPPRLFPDVTQPCWSFSQYWKRVSARASHLSDLLVPTT